MEVVLPSVLPGLQDSIFSAIEGSLFNLDVISSDHVRCIWKIQNFVKVKDLLKKKSILNGAVKSPWFGIGVEGSEKRFRLVVFPRSVNSDGILQASLSLETDENSSSAHIWCQLSIMKEDMVDRCKKFQGRSTLGRHGCLDIPLGSLLNPKEGYLLNDRVDFYAEICMLRESFLKNKELKAMGPVVQDKAKEPKGVPFMWYMENFQFFFERLGDQDMLGPAFQLGKSRLQIVISNEAGNLGAQLDFEPSSDMSVKVDYSLGVMFGGKEAVWNISTVSPGEPQSPIDRKVPNASYGRACFLWRIHTILPLVERLQDQIEKVEEENLEKSAEQSAGEKIIDKNKVVKVTIEQLEAEEKLKLEQELKQLIHEREENYNASQRLQDEIAKVKEENLAGEMKKLVDAKNEWKATVGQLEEEKIKLEQELKQLVHEREEYFTASQKLLDEIEKLKEENLKKIADQCDENKKLKVTVRELEEENLKLEQEFKQLVQEREGNFCTSQGLKDEIEKVKEENLAAEIEKLIDEEKGWWKETSGQLEEEKLKLEQELKRRLHEREEISNQLLHEREGSQRLRDDNVFLSERLSIAADEKWNLCATVYKLENEVSTLQHKLQMSFYTPLYGANLEALTVRELECVHRLILISLQQIHNALVARLPQGAP